MILILKNHRLPALYANEDKKPEEVTIPVKLFNPCGAATWWLTEYNPETRIAFGYCDLGHGGELGYVSITELEEFSGPFGIGIERDRHWDTSTTLASVMEG